LEHKEKAMKELAELLAQKENEYNNLSRQLEGITKELEAVRTTQRLLEQSGTTRSGVQENLKRPAASVKSDNTSRETVVAELP
jgi:uncharacterized coiled-coil protein SlyX